MHKFYDYQFRTVDVCYKRSVVHCSLKVKSTVISYCKLEETWKWRNVCRSVVDTIHMQIWNYLMAGVRLPQQLQHWPGFWALDWMLGPLSPTLIRISSSASDPCSRTCVVTLWCNRLYLTDCWRTPRCLWSTDVDVNDSASIAPGSFYDRLRAQTRLHDAGQH